MIFFFSDVFHLPFDSWLCRSRNRVCIIQDDERFDVFSGGNCNGKLGTW